MPKDYSTLPPNHVRRIDRAVEDETWIESLLQQAAFGSLATVDDGQPFINTNLFYYDADAHCIYMHTARTGRTRHNVESEGDRVCFSVSEMGRLLPAERAREFSVEYRGVVVFGRALVVEDEAEAAYCLQLLLDKYFSHLQPGRDYRPIAHDEIKATAVYRIHIEHWSGKQKKVADDFPGAFFYQTK
jgi:uncharacterized protein